MHRERGRLEVDASGAEQRRGRVCLCLQLPVHGTRAADTACRSPWAHLDAFGSLCPQQPESQ